MKNKISISLVTIFLLFIQSNLLCQDYLDMLPKDAVEVIELRTEESKSFDNPDGSRTTIIFGCNVHELNKNVWDNITPYMFNPLYTYTTVKKTTNSYRLPTNSEPQFSAGKTETTVDRSFIYWDTHILETGSTIIECKFMLPLASTNSSAWPIYDMVKLDENPKLSWPTPPESELNDRWNKIGDATTKYVSNINGIYSYYFTSNETTNSEFMEDLQSRISAKWMAVGIKNTDEAAANKLLNFAGSLTPLAVTYWPSNTHYNFRASPLNTSIPPGGGTKAISFSNVGTPYLGVIPTIEYEVVSTLPNWINYDGLSGQTPSAITFSAQTNNGSVPRSVTIEVEAVNPPIGIQNYHQNIVITQDISYPSALSVDYPLWQASEYGGTKDIYVRNSGNSSPLIYQVYESADWLWLTGLGGANGITGTTNSTFTINTLPNYTGTFRYTNIHIVSGSLFADVEVRQNPASTITLPDQQNAGQQTYNATNSITVNSFLVGSGGNVSSLTLKAGNKITFSPGFIARSDAGTFKASIQSFEGDNFELVATEQSKDILSLKSTRSSDSQTRTKGDEPKEITQQIDAIPTEYNLFQNYPNPFNPSTTIRFALPERAIVKIAIYNQLGQEIAEIANTELDAGFHTVNFNGSSLSSGIYFYRILTGKYSKTLKLLLVK